MYAFLDQIKEAPYFRDIVGDLDNLRSQIPSLTSNEFQDKLATLFNTLNGNFPRNFSTLMQLDAHTIYTKPIAYRNLFFVQPITTISFVKSNGQQGIFIYQVIDKSLAGFQGRELYNGNGRRVGNHSDKWSECS